jgi:DUF2075 family protein
MNTSSNFAIEQHSFDSDVLDNLRANHYAKDLWPVIYILSNSNVREAYIGETTDMFKRMESHLSNSAKMRLTSVHFIQSSLFNKSATLDIEANLIKYMSGDGVYQLQNGNLGIANHSFYQKKKLYWPVFKEVWDDLINRGIAKHSIEHIDNSDLFKYSPYKSLESEQREGLKEILHCILDNEYKTTVIEGGAGTGKTILAVFLFKLLATETDDFNFREFGAEETEFVDLIKDVRQKYPEPQMGLVVPMSSFRGTLQQVFRNVKGLKANMVIGPADVTKKKYDIVLVDESHRLRKKKSIGAYIGAFNKAAHRIGLDPDTDTELDWILQQAKEVVLFYDEAQSVKPSDVNQKDFHELKTRKSTALRNLKSQFRVRGGSGYSEFVNKLLCCKRDESDAKFSVKEYEFMLFDDVGEMVEEIKKRDRECGLCRTVAGFSWPWISNKEGQEHLKDIKIGDVELRWNNVTTDWINTPTAGDEVGCIHTIQGYDLNYAGVIFGEEIAYDKELDEIVVLRENYKDKTGRQADTIEELKAYIINIYKTVMLRGIRGTYIYACDSSLRDYFAKHIPMAPAVVDKQVVQLMAHEEIKPFENSIPLYPLDVAAGEFGEFQQVNDVNWIAPPEGVKPSQDLFACRVIGESMNKIIPNGSYCLFRKYKGGSRGGLIVLVQHTDLQDSDFGSCYTVKEYESRKSEGVDGWKHEEITLKPRTNAAGHEDLVLRPDGSESFSVLGVFISVL